MSAPLLVPLIAAACSSSHGDPPDGASGDGGGIALEQPPPRPAVDDGPSTSEQVFVLDSIRWDQRDDAWSTIGLDLDGFATTDASDEVECRAPAPSAPVEADGSRGIDNTFGHNIAPIFLLAFPGAQEGAIAAQAEGRGTLAVRVREWNGESDDPRVDVAVMPTVGFDDAGALEVAPGALSGGDLDLPILRDDDAYVAGGRVVTRLPDRALVPLAFGDGYLWVQLTDAWLLFTPDGTATLAGRWAILDVLSTSEVFCPGTSDYDAITRLLDLAADIRAVPGTGGDGVACDAISLGLTFAVHPAALGGVGAEVPPPSCP